MAEKKRYWPPVIRSADNPVFCYLNSNGKVGVQVGIFKLQALNNPFNYNAPIGVLQMEDGA